MSYFLRTRATCIAVLVVIMSDAAIADSSTCHSIAGTYSDTYYNDEGGDLLGTEIHIVQSHGHCIASVQHAEGVREPVLSGPAIVAGSRIEFTVKDGSDTEHYVGRITRKGFDGSYTVIRDQQNIVTNRLRLLRRMKGAQP